ncbi:MAG: type II toxin-antitoxin system HicA family toxin [Armatimonadetes bacterium]|nr:type II toxin-antitoxin system HicA family toxin [Armatimonadota bacterium]
MLRSLGYETVRQKGSHVTVRLEVGGGGAQHHCADASGCR